MVRPPRDGWLVLVLGAMAASPAVAAEGAPPRVRVLGAGGGCPSARAVAAALAAALPASRVEVVAAGGEADGAALVRLHDHGARLRVEAGGVERIFEDDARRCGDRARAAAVFAALALAPPRIPGRDGKGAAPAAAPGADGQGAEAATPGTAGTRAPAMAVNRAAARRPEAARPASATSPPSPPAPSTTPTPPPGTAPVRRAPGTPPATTPAARTPLDEPAPAPPAASPQPAPRGAAPPPPADQQPIAPSAPGAVARSPDAAQPPAAAAPTPATATQATGAVSLPAGAAAPPASRSTGGARAFFRSLRIDLEPSLQAHAALGSTLYLDVGAGFRVAAGRGPLALSLGLVAATTWFLAGTAGTTGSYLVARAMLDLSARLRVFERPRLRGDVELGPALIAQVGVGQGFATSQANLAWDGGGRAALLLRFPVAGRRVLPWLAVELAATSRSHPLRYLDDGKVVDVGASTPFAWAGLAVGVGF